MPPLTDTQLAERPFIVGASEVASALGLNEHCSAIDLYYQKLGMMPTWPETENQYWGHALEPALMARFNENHKADGLKVIPPPPGETIRHPDYPWAACTPDGYVFDVATGAVVGLWEGKTVWNYQEARKWARGADNVPVPYLLQAHWSLGILDLPVCYLSVLIAPEMRSQPVADFAENPRSGPYREYVITADSSLFERMFEGVSAFWARVEAARADGDHRKHCPAPDGSASSGITMKHIYGTVREEAPVLLANDDLRDAAIEYKAAGEVLKEAQQEHDRLKQEMQQAMGDEFEGIEGQGFRVSWKADKRGRRTFRADTKNWTT